VLLGLVFLDGWLNTILRPLCGGVSGIVDSSMPRVQPAVT
jgi:hypothetical protein